jgi:DNA-binding ferritin-like protein (Dps family)
MGAKVGRKVRETTSVSTLVSNVNSLIHIAHEAKDRDKLKRFADLHARINKLAQEYVEIRKEIDPYVKSMLTTVSISSILASISDSEEEVSEEVSETETLEGIEVE